MTSSETTFNDEELIEWLRKPYGDATMERAADRIAVKYQEVIE